MTNAKSSCVDEIKQLFPVSLKKFEAVSVESPSWVQLGAHEKKRVSFVNCCVSVILENKQWLNSLKQTMYDQQKLNYTKIISGLPFTKYKSLENFCIYNICHRENIQPFS